MLALRRVIFTELLLLPQPLERILARPRGRCTSIHVGFERHRSPLSRPRQPAGPRLPVPKRLWRRCWPICRWRSVGWFS